MKESKFDTEISNLSQLSKRNSAELRAKLVSCQGVKASDQAISWSILSMLPLFNKFMIRASDTGSRLIKFLKVAGHVTRSMQKLSAPLGIIRLISAVIDFIQIPCIYIAAMIAGENPFTLSNNARFLYSAVFLGLFITAFVFPPSALVIGLISIIAALGSECVTLTTLYMERYSLEDQLKKIESTIHLERTRLNGFIKDVERLECLEQTDNESQGHNFFDLELASLQSLLNDQISCQQKIDKLAPKKLINNAIGITLISVALIGMIVGFALPPVGAGIFAFTTVLGLTYMMGQYAYSLVRSLGKKSSPIPIQTPEYPEIESEYKADQSLGAEPSQFPSPLVASKTYSSQHRNKQDDRSNLSL